MQGTRSFSSAKWWVDVQSDKYVPTIREQLDSAAAAAAAAAAETPSSVAVHGWVRSVRAQKNRAFININDGSTFEGIQAVVTPPSLVDGLVTGCSIAATGHLASHQGKWELVVDADEGDVENGSSKVGIEQLGECDASVYPLAKKYHSLEHLRSVPQLRMRTNTIGAAMRVRNAAMMGMHQYFQTQGFVNIHTPILTPLDCEGAGELFQVTAQQGESKGPFFGRDAYLTVSGQLYAEMSAAAFSRVYTFGPTFRAELSHTSRHLAEFWMLEPEIAFADLDTVIACAQDSIKTTVAYILEHCADDLEFLQSRMDMEAKQRAKKKQSKSTGSDNSDSQRLLNGYKDGSLLDTLRNVADPNQPFARMPYCDAIRELSQVSRDWEHPVGWEHGLQSEHERWLAEELVGGPVFITDYPREQKPFYMRVDGMNPYQGETVACTDLLVPGIGEMLGGSQREERLDVLEDQLEHHGLSKDEYQWYLDLRRFGTVPHGGFGLGFERFVQWCTGLPNVRDVILMPRTAGSMSF